MALSYDSYTGDGSTTQFAVTFGYITASDVDVTVDGVSVSFTWDNAAQVNLAAAPAVDAAVLVVRDTQNTSRLVDFTATSLLDEATLDKDSNQLFYIVQEAFDDLSNALQYDATTGEYDANSKVIKNLADGVDDTDAANVGQIADQVGYAEEWANKAEDSLVSAAAGGDQVDDYSALHWAAKAAADLVLTNADVVSTNADVVSTNADVVSTNADVLLTAADVISAAASESLAEEWAEKAEDSAITGNPGSYSAFHWAQKAEEYAANLNIPSGVTDNLVSIDASDNLEDSGVKKANLMHSDTAVEVTKQINFDEQTLTSSGNAVAWNVENGPCAVHTLTENTTISAPTNLKAGGVYVLRVVQAAGIYTLAFNSVFKWGTADASLAPAASGDVVVFSGYSDGTNIYWVESVREEA